MFVFEPGNSYYMLNQEQYDELMSLVEGLGFDLHEDFQLAEDGNYYALATGGGIDNAEASFMEEWGFNNILEYKKSTQSTSFFD